ncbi:hypothetical protein BLNAU_14618 [Blattamonas nauphoetae]|uniref:Transmembrane protein n=1 Tax=Blattamonas nauphoetae TaxID=2049346 RepID=A0ABQ9XK30_9EUKA|nr:hypothetical protein BLNAU_14618 [Blattamonas nauphoetae]
MANHSQKKLEKSNTKYIRIIVVAWIIVTGLSVSLRVWRYRGSGTILSLGKDWFWAILTGVLSFLMMMFFLNLSRQQKQVSKTSGLMGSFYDIYIVMLAAQLLAPLSSYFWLLYLVLIFILVKKCSGLCKGMGGSNEPLTEEQEQAYQAMNRKEARRQQRRENRAKKARF